ARAAQRTRRRPRAPPAVGFPDRAASSRGLTTFETLDSTGLRTRRAPRTRAHRGAHGASTALARDNRTHVLDARDPANWQVISLASNHAKQGSGLLIVILNYRTADLTLACLRSLAREIPQLPGAEVVVTDNASGDGSDEKIARAITDMGIASWARCE